MADKLTDLYVQYGQIRSLERIARTVAERRDLDVRRRRLVKQIKELEAQDPPVNPTPS